MDKELFKNGIKFQILNQQIQEIKEKLTETVSNSENIEESMYRDLDKFFDDYIFSMIPSENWDTVTSYLTKDQSKAGNNGSVILFLEDAIVELYSTEAEEVIVALPKEDKATELIFQAIEKTYSISSKLITDKDAIHAAKSSYEGYSRKNWQYFSLKM